MTTKTRLAIVIVNWNSRDQLRACLSSIPAAAGAMRDFGDVQSIVVVDNGSADGSEAGLDTGALPLKVIRNQRNLGFATACNQGAAAAGLPDLLLFLNPDTLLYPHSLRAPVEAFQLSSNSRAGIVGVQLIDARGRISRSCSRFPRASQFLVHALGLDRRFPSWGQAMREWDHKSSRRVDQVIGAFFMVRTGLFHALSGFDERFFVYFEEVDFSLRAKRLGWDSLYLANAQAFHVGGGTSDQVKGHRLFYSLRSRLAYFDKHEGVGSRVFVRLVTWGLEPIARLAQLVLQRRWAEIRHLGRAYYWLATAG